jgi:hypothetical protein
MRDMDKFLSLRRAQGTGQRQRRTQAIDARMFLARVALYGNLYAFHGKRFAFRVQQYSQCLAGRQRGIIEVVRTWP